MMNWSETIISQILGKRWKFFELFGEDGETVSQAKEYDPPCWIAYPDFEKYENGKLVLLVEVKGYYGFFDKRDKALAMLHKQFKQYFVVQEKERVEIRVVFVIKQGWKTNFYWESLNNILDMEHYLDMCEGKTYIFWNSEDFRTDIKNLGLN